MLRIDQNPPQRWPEEHSLADCGNWWVAYTKPRNEKALAWDLRRLGIGYYLPMTTKRTRRRDNGKPRKSVICLFPGYVSLVDYPRFRSELYRTGRIARVIEVENQERFIRELDQIRQVINEEIDLQLHNDLAVGQRVLISTGPFGGIEGIIKNFMNEDHVFLNIEMFGRSVSIKVDPSILMPVS